MFNLSFPISSFSYTYKYDEISSILKCANFFIALYS